MITESNTEAVSKQHIRVAIIIYKMEEEGRSCHAVGKVCGPPEDGLREWSWKESTSSCSPTEALGVGEQVKVHRNPQRGDPLGPELSIPLPTKLRFGLLPTFCLACKCAAAANKSIPNH